MAVTATVAVSGLNATDNPGPGVAVIQALRADPTFQGRIIGLAYDVLDPGLYLPGLVDGAYLLPYPSAGREALFARLAHIQQEVGDFVLLPTLDSELPGLIGQEAQLAAMGIQTLLPTARSFDARAKARLAELGASHDIAVPATEVLTSPQPLYTVHERLGFPVVIKSPLYGATICHSVDEAVKAFHTQASKWGLPILAQQCVTGEEACVAVLGDGEGGTVGAVAMKKLLLTDSGKGWAGVTIEDDQLMALAKQTIAALKWRGGAEVECLRDADGTWYLLEINPRFPAWVDLTAGAGQNLPLGHVQLAMGLPAPQYGPVRLGTAFVRIATNTIVDIGALAQITTTGQTTAAHSTPLPRQETTA